MCDKPLPSVLTAAVENFVQWSKQKLTTEEEATKITQPLYHYTNAGGLRGIIESQRIWFTSYLHLNDPSELLYGMGVAHRLLKEIREEANDGLVQRFCDMVDDRFQHGNFSDTFGFYRQLQPRSQRSRPVALPMLTTVAASPSV